MQSCLRFFPCLCHKSTLKKKKQPGGGRLYSGSEIKHSPFWWGNQGSRSLKHLYGCSSGSLRFARPGSPAQGMVPPAVKTGFPILMQSRPLPPVWPCPDAHPQDDPRKCQVDNPDHRSRACRGWGLGSSGGRAHGTPARQWLWSQYGCLPTRLCSVYTNSVRL